MTHIEDIYLQMAAFWGLPVSPLNSLQKDPITDAQVGTIFLQAFILVLLRLYFFF